MQNEPSPAPPVVLDPPPLEPEPALADPPPLDPPAGVVWPVVCGVLAAGVVPADVV
ncbi:MAG TPA: hypothetical protein VFN65_07415 [Solirubrobacteraceae bacterium]|nr:hypothetical protein [Solirubrobacteraceae bacterium]